MIKTFKYKQLNAYFQENNIIQDLIKYNMFSFPTQLGNDAELL